MYPSVNPTCLTLTWRMKITLRLHKAIIRRAAILPIGINTMGYMETIFNSGSMTMTFHIINVPEGRTNMQNIGSVRDLGNEKSAKTY